MQCSRVLAWLLFVVAVVGCQPAAVAAPPTLEAQHSHDPIDPISGLPVVALAELPPEATDTLDAIDNDGPFPYDQDGAVFQNREGILPQQPGGYYHEYTVETPGSADRGARRIVTGDDGELYWTDDHYDSFEVIVR